METENLAPKLSFGVANRRPPWDFVRGFHQVPRDVPLHQTMVPKCQMASRIFTNTSAGTQENSVVTGTALWNDAIANYKAISHCRYAVTNQ